MMQGTSSNRQFVHGAPCSTTLQRTLRARQHWHAFGARRLTARLKVMVAELTLHFEDGAWEVEKEERSELERKAVWGVIVMGCKASIIGLWVCRACVHACF